MYEFWDNLKKECTRQGVYINEIAEKSNVNYGTIKNSISRNSNPSIEIAYKLANSLGVSIEYLLTGKTNANKRVEELESKLKRIEDILKE